ncbi:MAG: 50S ribosomal protein L32 [Chthoniobacterales bacterium]
MTKCPQCGSRVRGHTACPACGYYRGRQILSVEVA